LQRGEGFHQRRGDGAGRARSGLKWRKGRAMLDFLKRMTGMDVETPDVAAMARAGAQIVDVRTPGEFGGGHVRGSVNIPLDTLDRGISRLRKDLPVITCCASGMRSASAKAMLERAGFAEVVNGGGWAGLQRRLAE